MRKQSKILLSKQWLELTLCNMIDEIIKSLNKDGSQNKIMPIIKKYSVQISNSQKPMKSVIK